MKKPGCLAELAEAETEERSEARLARRGHRTLEFPVPTRQNHLARDE